MVSLNRFKNWLRIGSQSRALPDFLRFRSGPAARVLQRSPWQRSLFGRRRQNKKHQASWKRLSRLPKRRSPSLQSRSDLSSRKYATSGSPKSSISRPLKFNKKGSTLRKSSRKLNPLRYYVSAKKCTIKSSLIPRFTKNGSWWTNHLTLSSYKSWPSGTPKPSKSRPSSCCNINWSKPSPRFWIQYLMIITISKAMSK